MIVLCSGTLHPLVLPPTSIALLQLLDEWCKGKCAKAHGCLSVFGLDLCGPVEDDRSAPSDS